MAVLLLIFLLKITPRIHKIIKLIKKLKITTFNCHKVEFFKQNENWGKKN